MVGRGPSELHSPNTVLGGDSEPRRCQDGAGSPADNGGVDDQILSIRLEQTVFSSGLQEQGPYLVYVTAVCRRDYTYPGSLDYTLVRY